VKAEVTSIWLDSFPSLMLLPQQHVQKTFEGFVGAVLAECVRKLLI
jgi:hypothetical protein